MTHNNSARQETLGKHTREIVTEHLQQRDDVLLNVPEIPSENTPLIHHSSRINRLRPEEAGTIFDGMFRQNALPAYYETVNNQRFYRQQTDRFQTYKIVCAVILAMIAIVLTVLIVIAAQANQDIEIRF